MKSNAKFSTKDLVYIAIFAALLAICSWISINAVVPFTLQTFGVFLTCGLLGGRRGTLTILLYLLMAAIGIPVLAGFSGGLGILLGSTGGYIIGFVMIALLMWGIERFFGDRLWLLGVGMVVGMILCYFFGTVWYMVIYTRSTGPVSVLAALGWCVFPFVIPDAIKIALALCLAARLRRYVK